MRKLIAALLALTFVCGSAAAQNVGMRNESGATMAGADGDTTKLATDRYGNVITSTTVGGGATLFAEDAAHTTGDKGPMCLSRRIDSPATSAGTSGDYATLNTDAAGKLWTTGSYAEDSAHTSTDTGQFALGVANENWSSFASEGDYTPIAVARNGQVIVKYTLVEDAVIADAQGAFPIATKRTDSPASSADTTGDAAYFNTDAVGATWAHPIQDPTQLIDGDELATPLFAAINVDGADSDVIVTNTDTGEKILVLTYVVSCDGAGTITFEDEDGNDLTGAMPLAANGGISAPYSPVGLFRTPADKDLKLLKSAAVNCDGHLTYIEVD